MRYLKSLDTVVKPRYVGVLESQALKTAESSYNSSGTSSCVHSLSAKSTCAIIKELDVLVEDLQGIESKLGRAIEALNQQHDTEIENCFAHLTVTDNKDVKSMRTLFEKAMSKFKPISDEALNSWYQQYGEQKNEKFVLTVTPYRMNQLFLQALSTIPSTWSKEFALLLKTSLEYLKSLPDDVEDAKDNEERLAIAVKKGSIVHILQHLQTNEAFHLQNEFEFCQALQLFQSHNVDFSDCIILIESKKENCEVITFDKKFSRLPNVKSLDSL